MTKTSSQVSIRNLALALSAVLLLAGCSSSNENTPGPDQTREGVDRHSDWQPPAALDATCYESVKIQSLNPLSYDVNLDSAVDCTVPHVFEALDLVAVPAEILEGVNGEALSRELIWENGQSETVFNYFAWAGLTCQRSLSGLVGLDQVDVAGVSGHEAGLVPMFLGPDADGTIYTLSMAPAPQTLWDQEPAVLCGMVSYSQKGPRTQVSSGDFPVILDWRDPVDYPMARRWTCATDAEWQNCRDPHLLEHVVQFDALTGLGEPFLEKWFAALDPTEDQIDALIGSCHDALVTVTGFEPSEEVEHYAFITTGLVICALHGAGGKMQGSAVGAGADGIEVLPQS